MDDFSGEIKTAANPNPLNFLWDYFYPQNTIYRKIPFRF